MANTDLTRQSKFLLKKTKSLFADVVVEGASLTAGEIPAVTGNYLIGKLPPNAVITNAYVQVLTASDAATTATAKIGTVETGSQILSGVDLKALGKQGTFGTQVDTGTGQDIFMTFTYTGAATAVGRYVVAIDYDEYTKNNGEYTEIN